MMRTDRLGLLLLLVSVMQALADDSQWRPVLTLKALDTETVDVTTYGQVDFSDSISNPSQYMISEKVQFDFWRQLSLGLNYTFLTKRTYVSGMRVTDFVDMHRAEIELNPHWKFANGVRLNLRNRYEHRWIEDRGVNPRSRHRVELVFPVKGFNAWKDFFVSNEVFYDYRRHWVSQNRIVPLGFGFELAPQVQFRVYYMWDAVHTSEHWVTSHVLYTHLGFTFR